MSDQEIKGVIVAVDCITCESKGHMAVIDTPDMKFKEPCCVCAGRGYVQQVIPIGKFVDLVELHLSSRPNRV